MKTEEGNKLIAVFMGYEYCADCKLNGIKGVLHMDGRTSFHLDETKPFHAEYHSSWDWLMPVWIKFRGLKIEKEEYEQWVHSLMWYLYSSDSPYRLFERIAYAIAWLNKEQSAQVRDTTGDAQRF